MTEKVRIADVVVTDDGFYRVVMITENGSHTIELDRENAWRFMHHLLKMVRDA